MNDPRPTGIPHPPAQPAPRASLTPTPPPTPVQPVAGQAQRAATAAPARPAAKHDPHRDAIALEDEGGDTAVSVGSAMSKIKFSAGEHLTGQDDRKYKRKTCASGTGACRVRSFHGRLSDEGMAYMDDKINEWLDGHPDIEVKYVTTAVGVYEGKIKEPALVVNVWY